MANNTVAYDFSRFEERPRNAHLQEVNKPRKQKVMGFSFKSLLIVGIIITAITFLMIYNRVVLTELTAEVENANQTLSALENENVRLQMQIDRKMSINNVEEYAVEKLNMGKVEQYQIKTVSISQDEELSVMKDNSDLSFFQSVYAKIMGQ